MIDNVEKSTEIKEVSLVNAKKVCKKTKKTKPKYGIKVGQEVIVISGNHRGKTGVVKLVLTKKEKVVVEGVNLCKKSVKITAENDNNFVTFERPIHISNVMLAEEWKGKKKK